MLNKTGNVADIKKKGFSDFVENYISRFSDISKEKFYFPSPQIIHYLYNIV